MADVLISQLDYILSLDKSPSEEQKTAVAKIKAQAERLKELQACCDYIGFSLLQTRETGLEGINLKTRSQNAAEWEHSVARIVEILSQESPRVSARSVARVHAIHWECIGQMRAQESPHLSGE